MKRVLMIVQNDFVNDSRIIKEATSLGEKGYIVKVLALHNEGLLEEEDFKYFKVERIKLDTRNTLGKNKFAQVFKFIEFQNKCVRRAVQFKPDIVHCHDVYTLPIGKKIIKKLGRSLKFVYDSHELWREASNNASMPRLLLKLQNSIENNVVKMCDGVITVSNSIGMYLSNKYELKKAPIIIRNIPLENHTEINNNIFRERFCISSDNKIVLYQGQVSTGRGIEVLIDCIEKLHEKIVLVILGNGDKVQYYKNEVARRGLEHRVYFHDAVKSDILMKYTSSADLGMSLIKNQCLSYYYSLPNKMFEYIQAEVPVVCSDFPDMQEIIKLYGVGAYSDPENTEGLVNAITEILNNDEQYNKFRKNCKKAKSELNWECEKEKLLSLYDNLK